MNEDQHFWAMYMLFFDFFSGFAASLLQVYKKIKNEFSPYILLNADIV